MGKQKKKRFWFPIRSCGKQYRQREDSSLIPNCPIRRNAPASPKSYLRDIFKKSLPSTHKHPSDQQTILPHRIAEKGPTRLLHQLSQRFSPLRSRNSIRLVSSMVPERKSTRYVLISNGWNVIIRWILPWSIDTFASAAFPAPS